MKRDGIEEFRSPDSKSAPLGAGKIHVWRVDLPRREARAAARVALSEILAGYLGEADPELAARPDGKPELAAAPDRLSFNLSHSGALALVAIAPGDVEVGVDVERIRPRRDLVRLARRWLPEGDAAAVAAASEDEREAAFYAAWTRHEARVKCTGAGLSGPTPGPEVEAFQLDLDDGYAAAVAIRTDATPAGVPRIVLRDGRGRG